MVAAIKDDILVFFGQILPWGIAVDAKFVGETEHELFVIVRDGAAPPWRQCTFVQGFIFIRDDEVEVEAHHFTKAAAGFAGAQGIVEGKELRCQLGHGDATVEAGERARSARSRAACMEPVRRLSTPSLSLMRSTTTSM